MLRACGPSREPVSVSPTSMQTNSPRHTSPRETCAHDEGVAPIVPSVGGALRGSTTFRGGESSATAFAADGVPTAPADCLVRGSSCPRWSPTRGPTPVTVAAGAPAPPDTEALPRRSPPDRGPCGRRWCRRAGSSWLAAAVPHRRPTPLFEPHLAFFIGPTPRPWRRGLSTRSLSRPGGAPLSGRGPAVAWIHTGSLAGKPGSPRPGAEGIPARSGRRPGRRRRPRPRLARARSIPSGLCTERVLQLGARACRGWPTSASSGSDSAL